MLQEGSSQARYFVSRLIPAHKDPPYEQVLLCGASNFRLLCWYVDVIVIVVCIAGSQISSA